MRTRGHNPHHTLPPNSLTGNPGKQGGCTVAEQEPRRDSKSSARFRRIEVGESSEFAIFLASSSVTDNRYGKDLKPILSEKTIRERRSLITGIVRG